MRLKHFDIDEFACDCCGSAKMDANFLIRLDKARDMANVPFVVNSGFRCEKENERVGGVKNSAHTRGKAVDIRSIASDETFRILEAVYAGGFTRIGLGETFIHIDADDSLPQCVAWRYG